MDFPNLKISLITPVFNTEPQMLRECIESVLHQTYPNWELILVDDASSSDETRDVLSHYAYFDSRVKLIVREENGGISQATIDGLSAASGSWVGFLDHDDFLNLEALGMVAHVAFYVTGTDVIYSDEDKFEHAGSYRDAYRKPGWSPELLLCQNYLNHLTVYRRSLVERVGGMRLGFDGAQDWDLALRVTEQTTGVKRIPQVLYHWRVHPESTASSAAAKPYAASAAERVLGEALARRQIDGRVDFLPELGYFEVRRTIKHRRIVSVVIPTAGASRELGGSQVRLIDRTLQGLASKTDYKNIEIVVVLSPGTPETLEDDLRPLVGDIPIIFLRSQGRFDFAKATNRGVLASGGELVLLLNDDIEPISPDWLTRLVEVMEDETVGAVGPRLLFEDRTIQHAGVIHQQGMPGHLQRGQPNNPGYFCENVLTRNYLAVTGACLMTTREAYHMVGGLSPVFPMNYNDIDYCLKLYTKGLRSIYVGGTELYHYESSTREPTVTVHEIANYERFWRDLVDPDPYGAPARLAPSL